VSPKPSKPQLSWLAPIGSKPVLVTFRRLMPGLSDSSLATSSSWLPATPLGITRLRDVGIGRDAYSFCPTESPLSFGKKRGTVRQ
jgi:hypothetical protein